MRRGVCFAGVMALLMLLAAGGGCEAVFDRSLPTYRCSGTDPRACPADQVCAAALGVCVDGARACATTGCPPGEHCDTGTQQCAGGAVPPDASTQTDGSDASADQDVVVIPDAPSPDVADVVTPPDAGDASACPGALGCTCTSAADCASHICGDSTVLTASFVAQHGAACTTPCCTSMDCPGGYVCFGPGTAGSYCVNATFLGRPTVLAGAGAGAGCGVDGDCRSGKCAAGACVDVCCSNASCAAPSVCTLDTAGLDGHQVFACLDKSGSAAHAACASNASCASNVCESNTCRPHCCGTASCVSSGFYTCELLFLGADTSTLCRYPDTPATGAAFGQPCANYADCATRACDKASSTCSDSCCVDADCAAHPGLSCLPAIEAPHYLICRK